MRKLMMICALGAAVSVAGCQSYGPRVARVAPTGFEGSWVSTDGVAISNFNSGAFETVATDTGNKLATGSYVHISANTVQITVNSLIRQTTATVNCAQVSTSQLNCTAEGGQQFTLVRRAAG
ncbi:MAG: hypothetical protein K8H74_14730 [Notoacmeibacter sp.]|nr:hypothetical protein [Notoacmeibacter sp.]